MVTNFCIDDQAPAISGIRAERTIMITREDFKAKLMEWLSEETCEKLAYEAEQRFTEDGFESVYEVMLIWISGYDISEFKDMC
jgi:hypothetical protein